MTAACARYLAVPAILLAGTALADVFYAIPNYELPREDYPALELSACMKPHGLKLDRAVGHDDGDRKRNASVRCESHGVVDRRPMHYEVSCVREVESWRCWNTVEYLQAKHGSKELHIVAPRERMNEAYGATKYLLKIGEYDFKWAGICDDVGVKPRTSYHVHVEAAGERAVRIQAHAQWLYVEKTADGNGYREVPEAQAAVLAAQIQEEVAARRPVYNYFWGHHTGNARHFREVFLPTAHIEGNRDGKFVSWTLDEYCGLFNGTPAEDELWRVRTIDHTDVSGDSAIVKATLDHGDTLFTDYFLMVKVNGEWKIANKVYTSRKK
jgi:hypothetical protein